MNVKDKFNNMMLFIEDEVNKKYPRRTKYIADIVQNQEFYSPREINAIFKYLTEKTLLEYIRERKLMAAYSELINSENWEDGLQDAISRSDSNDQSTLIKRFRESFNMTPKEAYEQKDTSLIKPVSTWDYISSADIDSEVEKSKQEATPLKFGLSQIAYKKATEAAEWQSFYSMSDEESEIAFSIAEKLNINMRLAFDFIFECGDCDIDTDYSVEQLISIDMLYAYIVLFNGVLDYKYVDEFIQQAHSYDFDIRKLKVDLNDIDYFESIYNQFYTFSTLELIIAAHEYNHAKQNVDDCVDFEGFLFHISFGMDPKDAVKEMPKDYGIADFYEDMNADQYDDCFEDDYSDDDMNKYDNYDEDNPYYSESDEDIKADSWYGFHEEY